MLRVGIIGLPNVGKSTLFKALTKKQVDISNYPFCTIEPNVGIVKVPDQRLYKLSEMSKSQKTIPAIVEFVDIAGLVKGASKGEGLGNKFLSHIREVDAIVEVVRVFENTKIQHVNNVIDPLRDIDIIHTELILADLETVEKALPKLEKESRGQDKEAIKKVSLLNKIKGILNQGKLVSQCELEEEEKRLIKDFHFLTAKKILYVYNYESNMPPLNRELEEKHHVCLDIKMEEELSTMTESDIKEIGIEPKINNLIKEAFRLLNLIVFFTTGPKETRAWEIKKGSTAPQAGRAIHSDFETKFIRAEVIQWDKLLEAGSWGKARELGLIRTEGKDYIVQDGDVMLFLI